MKELIFHRSFVPAINRFQDQLAVVDGAHRASFREHGDHVFRLCDALKRQLGLARADRFAVMAKNSHAFLALYHAAYLGAGVITPLNLRLAADEIELILCDSGAKVVFTDAEYLAVFESIIARNPNCAVEKIVVIDGDDQQGDLQYAALVKSGDPVTPSETDEEDPVLLMYTGGTTGMPKGVVHTQRSEILNLYHCIMSRNPFHAGDVNLIQTPMFHAAVMPTIVGSVVTGGATVLIPEFTPEHTLRIIEQEKVTLTMMVPTMIDTWLHHPSFDRDKLQSLRTLFYGAAPMSPALLQQLLISLPAVDLWQGYGMTEAATSLTNLSPADHRAGGDKIKSVGVPSIGVEISIQDENGNTLGAGSIGEVCARGGNFMREYWNQLEMTAEAFKSGWYHTGDAGYLDEDGYLYLVDRLKDMIISGGENVFSIEVENAISTHDKVAQVVVIGMPDKKWGERVHAIVVPVPGTQPKSDEIIDHARKTIAGYKVPKSVDFREDPLPLSGAMKVLKRQLRVEILAMQGATD